MAVPAGIICAFHGAVVDIPAGYTLCDGKPGTPDLRDRMIIGAGGAFAVGANGGAINHNHTFTGDGHFHGLGPGFAVGAGATFDSNTTVNPATGTTDNANGMPPYYALAWIIKL